MGAISLTAKRIMAAMSGSKHAAKDFTAWRSMSETNFGAEVPTVLRAQINDLTAPHGIKMSPVQTERSIKTLLDLAPTSESRAQRQLAIDQLKETGIFNEPGVERIYAAGSIATPKNRIKDLDFVPRVDFDKLPSSVASDLEDIAYNPGKHKYKNLDLPEYTTPNANMAALQDQQTSLEEMALEGANRYGKKYKWIRLLGATPAIPGGGWPPYEEQD